jgi:hypothetical protein
LEFQMTDFQESGKAAQRGNHLGWILRNRKFWQTEHREGGEEHSKQT